MSEACPSVSDPNPPSKERAFGRTYWMLNSIEMFERLAYFGIRAVVPIYIMQATEPGGLHLTAIHKGWIYMWWAILQSWLPMFTGGIADRYGYKRVLVCAISANVVGYVMMAYLPSYEGFFAGILVLATGTAFFKPALQGSIAQRLTKENASMGWGIFYWVVNIGAVLAPILATVILGKPHSAEGWRILFLASAVYTAMNLLLLLTFKDVPSGADKSQSLVKVFAVTIENIWPYWLRGGSLHPVRGPVGIIMAVAGIVVLIFWSEKWYLSVALFLAGGGIAAWLEGGRFTWQLRLPAFLLIMSCFWMMMYQLWDLHPNFIEDWIDSSMVAAHAPSAWQQYGDRGLVQVPQQILLNLNAFLIVLLIVPISWLVRKMRTLSAMLVGMSVATTGILVAGLTGNGWVFLLGVVFFSFGEMLTGPKKNQYLGLIAPPGKKGLYLGYVNIPIGIGVGFGSMIAGIVYDNYGEKAGLALKELATKPELLARAARSADWSDALEQIPPLLNIDRGEAFDLVRADMGVGAPTTAQMLRDGFRYDRGQIANLALQYIALNPEYREKTVSGLAKLVEDLGEQLGDETKAFADQIEILSAPADEQAEQGDCNIPAADHVLGTVDDIKAMVLLARELASGEADVGRIGIARFVHLLPDVLGKKRVVAFGIVREELVNKGLPQAEKRQDAEIIDMLWQRFGDDPEVLNNLALEYLAQATPRIHDAVAGMIFEHPPEKLKKRIEEIEERLGIGRTKSFAALSAATGANEAEVDRALAASSDIPADAGRHDHVFTYLIDLPHCRWNVVGRKDWTKDTRLLQEIIGPDENARKIVLAEIDQETWYQKTWSALKGIFVTEEDEGKAAADGVDYTKLADKQDLIQKALDAKNWSKSARQAALLLDLNPFEARALVAAEVNNSAQAMTRQLWDEYHPQYKVWMPFAAIGVVAMIALAIFGQMAKKWKDMNA